MYYAHSADRATDWEPLKLHLETVAGRAAGYAAVFDAADEARLAGLLHDLGKYTDLFLERLRGKAKHLDHWSIGAWAALRRFGRLGIASAVAIHGHHVGLRKADNAGLRALDPTLPRGDGLRPTETDHEVLLERLRTDGLVLPTVESSIYSDKTPHAARMLDLRMLFSCLVDADFLETEAHFRGQATGTRVYREPGPELDADRALEALGAHLGKLAESSDADGKVLTMRRDLLRSCRAAAERSPGLFTLTAPTGAGKTLSMLAFALGHARKQNLRRIVMVIPYLTILEQTAKTYRDLLEPVFGRDFILEHHSLGDGGAETKDGEQDSVDELRRRRRELAENWDAPLVLTTNVQLLESLFSNRPGACRKLHRLAGSVILFDEVQTLPPHLAVATLATLSRLAERFRSTVVFSTATQPAFDHLHEHVRELAAAGWQPREIATPELDLFRRTCRTAVRWDIDRAVSWAEVAEAIEERSQVLCIVNLKAHARDLALSLKDRKVDGLFHLTTNLCPAHRRRVLDEVRRRLADRLPCRLVSTQCVEAGVDVDFPAVFRSLGPLDSIAQAAGRCNRRGRMPERGDVWVFLPEDPACPPGAYAQAAQTTATMLRELGVNGVDIASPATFAAYYRRFYDLTGITEGKDLREAIESRHFEKVAELYRVIDEATLNVVVPYDLDVYADLRRAVDEPAGLCREWIRKARPHAISLYRRAAGLGVLLPVFPARRRKGLPDEQATDWFVYAVEDHYDRDLLGLRIELADNLWIA